MFLLLILCSLWQEVSKAAVATFSVENTGISGTVVINDRYVTVNLNVSQLNLSQSNLPSDCFTYGVRYHVHSKWGYTNTKDRINSSACGSAYTGGHWDPWVACSASTSNVHCKKYSSTSAHKCVESSSAYSTSTNYTCTPDVYQVNPFACEVSDFDGKYGRLYLNSNNDSFIRTDVSFWEMKSIDLHSKSIVFHCGNSNQRAFCAPFSSAQDVDTSQTITQPYANNMKATFKSLSDDSVMELNKDGSYKININLEKVKSTLDCDRISYRIYNSWKGTDTSYIGNKTCLSVIGQVYDPTVSCLPNSDSSFCSADGHICNDTASVYNCSFHSNRHSCSPSDLSAKYGFLFTDNFTIMTFSINGTDDLMIPLDLIQHKSIALECLDSDQIIACAKLNAYAISDDSDDDSWSSVYTVVIVICSLIGCIILGCGCFYWIKQRKLGYLVYDDEEEENSPLK